MADEQKRTTGRHREMLIIALVVIAASFVLQVNPGRNRVALRNVPEAMVPPTCMSNEWFGIRCPGCGLTRSFIYLAQGDPVSSWQSHRLGWLLAAATLAQVPYRLHELCRPRKRVWMLIFSRWFGRALIALLVGNWLLELILSHAS
jgi:hypothetical protein